MSKNISQAVSYLKGVVEKRLEHFFAKNKWRQKELTLPSLNLSDEQEPLGKFIQHYDLSTEEAILLLTALMPHILPTFFESIIAEHLPKGGEFPEFGGIKGENRRSMLPTGETALFLLAGTNLERRLQLQSLFSPNHFFSREKILYLDDAKIGEPPLSAKLILDEEYIELFLTNQVSVPKLSTSFPAQYINTAMDWSDLVLPEMTLTRIKELENWINHNDTLLQDWGMHKKIKPGYRALFYGPPGTGKTLTATLLGKYTNKPVFKIDLSMIVSKYIGETEKNLSKLFDKAQHKNWILFFDEADSLFGKRTNVRDAHDKYANQEVSYLLQRIENYPGLTILASNFKNNIDDAFMRRFQAVVFFPQPKPKERLMLWKKSIPENIQLAPDVDLEKVATQYELTGSGIMNIIHYCCIELLAQSKTTLDLELIKKGITKEYDKMGRMI